MYKLTLTAAGYNRIEFIFDKMSELTSFLTVVMKRAKGEIEAKISLMEKEGEEECSSEN